MYCFQVLKSGYGLNGQSEREKLQYGWEAHSRGPFEDNPGDYFLNSFDISRVSCSRRVQLPP